MKSFHEDETLRDVMTTMTSSGRTVPDTLRDQISRLSYNEAMQRLFQEIPFKPCVATAAASWNIENWRAGLASEEQCYIYSLFWFALCALFPDKHVETKPIFFTIGGAVFREHFQIFMKCEQVGGMDHLIRMRRLKEEYRCAGGEGESTRLSNYIRDFFKQHIEGPNRRQIIMTIEEPGYKPAPAGSTAAVAAATESQSLMSAHVLPITPMLQIPLGQLQLQASVSMSSLEEISLPECSDDIVSVDVLPRKHRDSTVLPEYEFAGKSTIGAHTMPTVLPPPFKKSPAQSAFTRVFLQEGAA